MSSLQQHVDDYLRLRRGLGFKLERHGQILPQLAAYLEAAGTSTVTRELAIAWARLPAGAHPRHWAARSAIARGFAAYLQTIDPATEIPPAASTRLSVTSERERTCVQGRGRQRSSCRAPAPGSTAAM
jgi:integrase/recombinase XerD